MSTPHISSLPFSYPLPNASRGYIYFCEHRQWIWKVAPFVSAQRYPYPELLLPYKRQVWKVGPFRNPLSSRLDISLLLNSLLQSHLISWLLILDLSSEFSFVPLACYKLTDKLTALTEVISTPVRITDNVDGGMIPTNVKTNHCSDRAVLQ